MSNKLEATYKVVEDCRIETLIYVPEESSSRAKHPVIIEIHGGGFMLGHSGMVNQAQIRDCLDRGWIVVVPDHRLCPQVEISAIIDDIRDLLRWIQTGKLDVVLAKQSKSNVQCDLERIIAFGTSAGGHLSLCLGYGVEKPVAAILDFYGPCNFTNPFWSSKIASLHEKMPKFPSEFMNKVYTESPIPTKGGVSLEGQATGGPNFKDPRVAFAMTHIANGTLLSVCAPSKDYDKIDPIHNIAKGYPPTCIVHGQSDTMVPITLSQELYAVLKREGVECEMIEVPGEEHTFAGKMVKGGQTWELQRKGFDWVEAALARV
ncbi:putative U3 small nucleolar RNA-associated protein 13 [Venturia nashicola]|uniref:Putative U3 small nucleolar RNA-associated protein 13 n=1 Tax=Venturia nashicola TaxID=86259 RepID=A0A4Z1PTE3_9PEZI|nr:putative U3 small nucleolar RNA-associated protein 13 [Venturia nashicola]